MQTVENHDSGSLEMLMSKRKAQENSTFLTYAQKRFSRYINPIIIYYTFVSQKNAAKG